MALIPPKPLPLPLNRGKQPEAMNTVLIPKASSEPTMEAVTIANLSEAIDNITKMVQEASPTGQIHNAMLLVQRELAQHDYLAGVLLPEQVGELVTALQIIHNARLDEEFAMKPTRTTRAPSKASAKKAAIAKLPKLKIDLGGLGDL